MSSLARFLIVGGHDPSGAGIEADLSAVSDLDVEAIAVVTARTDQDDGSLRSIGARDAGAWKVEALERAREGIAALKFGLLPGAEHVRAARDLVREVREVTGREIAVVVDPVIRASSGGLFLDALAVEAVRRELVAEGVIMTPNIAEAAELAEMSPLDLEESLEARVAAARVLLRAGARAVVVKGGHGREDPACDLVAVREGGIAWIRRPRIAGGSIRGSGCRFASRLAAGLALGWTIEAAAERAGGFVAALIERRAGASGAARR